MEQEKMNTTNILIKKKISANPRYYDKLRIHKGKKNYTIYIQMDGIGQTFIIPKEYFIDLGGI